MKSLINYIIESQQVTLDSDGKEHGFDYVDLGLPSGTMWATCNVGADKPEDDGLLFQFGRTDGYKHGDKKHNFYTPDEDENSTGNEHIKISSSGTIYKKNDILKLDDDAAHVNMGGKWKMPSKADLQELYDNTTKTVVSINGKKGMLFTSNINGKSIFIVFAGFWSNYNGQFCSTGSKGYGQLRSSEVHSSDYNSTWVLYFDSYGDCYIDNDSLVDAFSVRGVFKKK